MKKFTILKYNTGGSFKDNDPRLKNALMIGGRKHLSGPEFEMYKVAFIQGDKKRIQYFENKINKGLYQDKMNKDQEMARMTELVARDKRDGTNLAEAQESMDSWKGNIPFYNTLSGNALKLGWSDLKEGLSPTPEFTEQDYNHYKNEIDNKLRVTRYTKPNLPEYQMSSLEERALNDVKEKSQKAKRFNNDVKSERKNNLMSAGLNFLDPVLDIAGIFTGGGAGAYTLKQASKQGLKGGLRDLAKQGVEKLVKKETADKFLWEVIDPVLNIKKEYKYIPEIDRVVGTFRGQQIEVPDYIEKAILESSDVTSYRKSLKRIKEKELTINNVKDKYSDDYLELQKNYGEKENALYSDLSRYELDKKLKELQFKPPLLDYKSTSKPLPHLEELNNAEYRKVRRENPEASYEQLIGSRPFGKGFDQYTDNLHAGNLILKEKQRLNQNLEKFKNYSLNVLDKENQEKLKELLSLKNQKSKDVDNLNKYFESELQGHNKEFGSLMDYNKKTYNNMIENLNKIDLNQRYKLFNNIKDNVVKPGLIYGTPIIGGGTALSGLIHLNKPKGHEYKREKKEMKINSIINMYRMLYDNETDPRKKEELLLKMQEDIQKEKLK